MFFSVLVMFLMTACSQKNQLQPKETQFLFVGNSLTYYNDLPNMVMSIYSSIHNPDVGNIPTTDMLAQGGISIEQHLNIGVLQGVLKNKSYDYVILQDFGGWPLCGNQIPACSSTSEPQSKAIELVRAAGAKPIWYTTYGVHPNRQRRLSAESELIANQLGVVIADVGAALHAYSSTERLSDLLTSDYHPNVLGSWVAAAAIVRSMLDQPIPESILIKNSCRQIWQGSDISANRLATDQQSSSIDCGQLSQEEFYRIILSVNDAYNTPTSKQNIN